MSDPLADTLFRPTTARSVAPSGGASLPRTDPSAAPVRVTGTRTRAGNAMSRTRSALLVGAARAVQTSGTRIAMAQVAVSAGVAKATLYNHFRTREAVLSALLIDQIDAVATAQLGKPIEAALIDAATAVSGHPVRAALADIEPAVLAHLGRLEDTAAGWQLARTAVDRVLSDAGRAGSDTVLRWLASFLLSPADPATIAADVAVLTAGLPVTESVRATSCALPNSSAPPTSFASSASSTLPTSRPRPAPRSA